MTQQTLSIADALKLGLEHQNAGRLQQAEHIYRQVLNTNPDHPQANNLLGLLACQVGKYDTAAELISRAIKSDAGQAGYFVNLGLVHQARGTFEKALECFDQALRIHPGHAGAHNNRGTVLEKLGNFEAAIAAYADALQIEPGYARAHNNLGVALQKSGRTGEALAAYEEALRIDPRYAEAQNNLAVALEECGRFDSALEAFDQAIRIDPDYARAHNNRGVALQNKGRFEEALAAFDRALPIEPNYAEAHSNRGIALQALGRFEAALSAYDQAIRIRPDHARAHNHRGTVLEELGRFEAALAAFDEALRVEPGYAETHNNRGVAFHKNGKYEEAIAAFEEALRLNSEYAEAHNNRAVALEECGRFEESMAGYKRALQIKPDYAAALYRLSMRETHTEYSDALRKMEALFEGNATSDEEKIHLGFGLGKAFEDLERYEKAFEYFAEANRLKRNRLRYEVSNHERVVDRVEAVFDQPLLERFSGHGHGCRKTPIFITGMPRSGTTLVEQILASHQDVFGAGELEDLKQIVLTVPENVVENYPDYVSILGETEFSRRGAEYMHRIKQRSKGEAFITDKMPSNAFFIGMIHLMLSDAKIIHCERDPLDTCWSCFKSDFQGALDFAYDLTELGQYHRLHDRLMDHWRRVIPGRVLDVKYEELVADQEAQTRRLLEYCGLEWDEACLSFHQTKRPVRTLSTLQVRRPLYSSSVGAWKNYQRHLRPLITSLEAIPEHF